LPHAEERCRAARLEACSSQDYYEGFSGKASAGESFLSRKPNASASTRHKGEKPRKGLRVKPGKHERRKAKGLLGKAAILKALRRLIGGGARD
jgi:hypothetical protein